MWSGWLPSLPSWLLGSRTSCTGQLDEHAVQSAVDQKKEDSLARGNDAQTRRSRVPSYDRQCPLGNKCPHAREMEHMRYVLDYDGFWDFDLVANKEYMSPRFWTMLGYNPEEKADDPQEWLKLLSLAVQERVMANFRHAVDTRNAVPFAEKIKFPHGKGGHRWVLCRGKVVEYDGDRALRAMGTHTDITPHMTALERETELKVQEQQRQLQLKAHFNHINHELRTPLHSITGFAELLLDSTLTDEQRGHVESIARCSSTMLTIVNQVLDFGKLDNHAANVFNDPFSPHYEVHRTVDMVRPLARKKNLSLEVKIAQDVPVECLGDQQKIAGVLLNLLSNAIKFTDKGTVTVSLGFKLGGDSDSVDLLELAVADTGRGMDEDTVKQLFKPYVHKHKDIHGTGLGLVITKKTVELLGGTIAVDSKLGAGSRFLLSLPINRDTSKTQVTPSSNVHRNVHDLASPSLKGVGGRILVADDSRVGRKLMKHVLQKLELSCHMAKDGQEAVELSQEEAYDVIFMDGQMPVLDGYKAARRIRDASPSTFLVLTSAAAADESNLLQDTVFDYRLVKPFRKNDVARCIQMAANARSSGSSGGS